MIIIQMSLPRLSWMVRLGPKRLRVSMLMVIKTVVNTIIVTGGISWGAAGTRPGHGCLHGMNSCRGKKE